VFTQDRHGGDNFFLTTSADGVRWSKPALLFSESKRYVVSPTVTIGPNNTWRMWTVDAGSVGCAATSSSLVMRTSTDGRKWSKRSTVSIAQPGYTIWHIDIQWIPSRHQYWALYAAYPATVGCGATSLFLATSADGSKWTTYPSPVLAPGVIPQFETNVYRSSFVYDPASDEIAMWLSGARTIVLANDDEYSSTVLQWSAAVARTTSEALFERITRHGLPPTSITTPSVIRELSMRNLLP
jgi:hypothetical protein